LSINLINLRVEKSRNEQKPSYNPLGKSRNEQKVMKREQKGSKNCQHRMGEREAGCAERSLFSRV